MKEQEERISAVREYLSENWKGTYVKYISVPIFRTVLTGLDYRLCTVKVRFGCLSPHYAGGDDGTAKVRHTLYSMYLLPC